MKNESVNIAHIGNDAMQAKKLAESFAEQKWPNPPIGIEAIFFPEGPMGPTTETVDRYLSQVGIIFLLSVHIEVLVAQN